MSNSTAHTRSQSQQRANGVNGHHDAEGKSATIGPLVRSPFRALVQDFSPIWFTWCMNSGIIGILLHQHPYQFSGIRTLSVIAFIVDLVLWIAFSAIFLLRFAIFRSQAYHEITSDVGQLTLCACWVIGYTTLPTLISLNVSQAYWGGYWATLLAYVMWWFGALWMLVVLYFVFSTITRQYLAGGHSKDASQDNTHNTPLPILVILPAVGVVTVAVTGCVIVGYSSHMTARLAVPVIIASLPLTGLGMTLACFLFAILWRQLLETGFPDPTQITSLFIYVGPFGQSAAALQAAGSSARAWFREYNRGYVLTQQFAQFFDAACVLGALLLLGPAAFFTTFSIYAMIDSAISTRKVKWSPGWNAIIFPTATMTTATTYLAVELDSSAFKVLTSIQLVFLVIVYFINAGFTLVGIFKGELLIVREDPRVKRQIQEQHKER